jgi:putative FmdB family regulatory protein
MPIYEYQCVACGKVLEKWQKISDDPIKVCPKCGDSMHKLVSCCSFQLKGSGWYQTDYSSGKVQTANMASAPNPEAAAPAPDNGGGQGAGEPPPPDKTAQPETETKTTSLGKVQLRRC